MTGYPRVYREFGATVWCTHNPPDGPCPVCERAARGSKPEPKKKKQLPVSRAMGELVRAYEHLKQLSNMLTSVRIALDEAARGVPIGMDLPQALVGVTHNVSATLIRLDAYQRAEDDRKPRQDIGRFSDHAIEGAVATCRESFRNDGAEGESVHLVCDALLDARAEILRLKEKLGEA